MSAIVATDETQKHPEQQPPRRERVALWDNARFALIVLVVIGHLISTVRMDTALGYGLYVYIYLFHMPAMIALSGVFSRPEVTPKAIRSTVQLLAVWGVWEGIWALLRFFVEQKTLSSSFLVSPAWTLWFLVSLATMRILLPFFARLRHPLIASLILALAAGLSPAIGADFSASRTLCLTPFFVAGWLARDRGWFTGAWFMRPTVATRGLAWGLFGALAAAFLLFPQLRQVWRIDSWLRWRDDYELLFEKAPLGDLSLAGLGVPLAGIGLRFVLLALAAAMTLALLLVIPRAHSVATVWGARTLFVYLLHGPIIWTLRESGVVDWFGEFGGLGIVLLALLGVVLAVLLSLAWVSRLTRFIIEPRIDMLFLRS